MSNGDEKGLTPYQEYCKRKGVDEGVIWIIIDETVDGVRAGFCAGDAVKLIQDDGTDMPYFTHLSTCVTSHLFFDSLVPDSEQPQENPNHSENPNSCPKPIKAKATQPLKTQIGGDHYKNLRIQPLEYIMLNEIPYIEANVIKYVTRWRSKGGVEDLKKARHYLDILINSVEEGK